MIDLRNLTYRQFNDRTLKSYIDDSDKRLNAYVPSSDKEDWQANVALPTVRDKLKRILSGYSLTVPELKVTAGRITGELDVASIDRGEIAQKLVKSSYLENENPVIENFWEAWEMAARGTCIKYEGYLNTTFKQKFIKSYDPVTGIVEEDEREVTVDDKCISYLVPLTELYISDFYIHDIQDQPAIAWITYRSLEQFKYEFKKYKNADKVKNSQGLREDTSSFYKQDHWGKTDRAGKEKVEIIRYYNRLEDKYIIIANGIILAETPLLWQFNGKKVYPFAKAVLEPFEGKHFFYGKSFPDMMMGQYDLLNAYFNSTMDKGFKNLNPPTLIGRVNQDAFDLEDELLSTDTKIYVDDINQVKPMPIDQVSQADVAMIELLARGIEDSVPSMPHLMQGKEATAREVVITEERMKELRNIYHEMLVDLWRQKYQIRLANIMLSYPVPKTVYENGKTEKIYKTFVIENAMLDKDTKERGILAVQFRRLSKAEKREAELDMAAEKEAMATKGVNYRKIILDPGYFDGFRYKMTVIPESLHRTSMARLQATILEELATVATYFPQVFIANQKEYFEDVAKAYGRDPVHMVDQAEAMSQEQPAPMEEGGAPMPTSGMPEQTSPISI
ncbi:MAG: hypothetical protein WC261_09515 [Synergistaceae bacterium]